MQIYPTRKAMLAAIPDKSNKFFFTYPKNVNDPMSGYLFTYIDYSDDFFKKIKKFFGEKYCIYLNEIILDGFKRKPYLDLDFYITEDKIKNINKQRKRIVEMLINDITKVFKITYNIQLKKNDILFLESSGKVDKDTFKYKISFHVIVSPKYKTYYYENNVGTTSSCLHFYQCLVKLNPEYESLLDRQVYHINANMRMPYCYKRDDRTRYFVQLDTETFKLADIVKYSDIPKYMITHVTGKQVKLITDEIPVFYKTNVIIPVNNNILECKAEIINFVKEYHPTAYCSGYGNGCYRFSYKNREEPCPFSGKTHDHNGLSVYETGGGFFMQCFSESCREFFAIHLGHIHKKVFDSGTTVPPDGTQVIDIKAKILGNNRETLKIVKNWMGSADKVLAIKSPMGTGKTQLVKYIFNKYSEMKCITIENLLSLWLGHRQTLINNLDGTFTDYNFANYQNAPERLYLYDRLFVQLDSLLHVINHNINDGHIKQYDFVVIDEVDSLLAHFSSPFIDRNSDVIFSVMIEIITHAKKLLIMDADLGHRSKILIDKFKNSTVINNTFLPLKKNFILTNHKRMFLKQFWWDIDHKHNICVASMSSSAVEELAALLDDRNKSCDEKDKLTYILHTGKTDDELKTKLKDVNGFWSKYNCIFYSPTIESGVDFNVKHVHRVYGIICDGHGTCSQRSFLQMIGRVRDLGSQYVPCLYERLPIYQRPDGSIDVLFNSNVWTYEDILDCYRNTVQINNRRDMNIIADRYREKALNPSPDFISDYRKIRLLNDVEDANKIHNVFITELDRLINLSGHTIQYKLKIDKPKAKDKKEKKNSVREQLIQKLASFKDDELTDDKIAPLLKKQNNQKCKAVDKLIIKRHFFDKKFGNPGENITLADHLREYLDKDIFVSRYAFLFKHHNLKKFGEHTRQNEKARIDIILDLVNLLLGTNYASLEPEHLNDIRIRFDIFIERLGTVANDSVYYNNEKCNRILFKRPKGNIRKFDPDDSNSIRAYIIDVQKILKQYNIILLSCKRKTTAKERDEEGITAKKIKIYTLNINKSISDIFDNRDNDKLLDDIVFLDDEDD